MFRHLVVRTAGESHGRELTGLVEGLPAGVPVSRKAVEELLQLRQTGVGSGPRMKLEKDRVLVTGGIRHGVTLGSPLAFRIANKDASIERLPNVAAPRPGHADLAGILRRGDDDVRAVLERASARETAARVAAAGLVMPLLEAASITVLGHVTELGGVRARRPRPWPDDARAARDSSPYHGLDRKAERPITAKVAAAKKAGDTLGGVVEVVVQGAPPGLGGCESADVRLEARLTAALMSIPAMKGVEIGMGFAAARRPGSRVHDEIRWTAGRGWRGFWRPTNRAGGIEGGMSNGEDLVARVAMKPLPTLRTPLASVRLENLEPARASVQRSDVCAVPRAAIVAEGMVALVVADALLERFWAETMDGVVSRIEAARRAPGPGILPGNEKTGP